MTHKHTQNEILIRKRKQNAYEVVRFPIISDNEMKRGKVLIPNEDRCTITILEIDEDIVLPSAKKVKADRDEKDIITDNKIQKSEIEQTLDPDCQTDKAYFVSAKSLNDEEKSFLENIFLLASNGNTIPIRTQPPSGVGTFVQMSCKQDFTTA